MTDDERKGAPFCRSCFINNPIAILPKFNVSSSACVIEILYSTPLMHPKGLQPPRVLSTAWSLTFLAS